MTGSYEKFRSSMTIRARFRSSVGTGTRARPPAGVRSAGPGYAATQVRAPGPRRLPEAPPVPVQSHIRSVHDEATLTSLGPFDALTRLTNGNPWLPALT